MGDEQKLEKLAKQIKVCTLCELHRSRTEAVPGEGPTHAEIMLIGEGPGASEDKQGRPFVGASGKFLNQLLEQAGVTRTDVFITNVVK
jgi:uracil-DNA glycosylase family 4